MPRGRVADATMLRCLLPLAARHSRHYARRRPARGGKDARAARDSAFSPTLKKPTKPAAESHHPMHGTTRATSKEAPDERVTIIGSMVVAVGVMGAGTIGYRLYHLGEISTPVPPKPVPSGEAGSGEAAEHILTVKVRLSPAATSLRSLWVYTCGAGPCIYA